MLQREANGWNRTGDKGILPVLNDVLNILLQNQTEQTVSLTSEGQFPTITTTDNNYEYSVPIDIWRVAEVLIDYPTVEYGVLWADVFGTQLNIQGPIQDRHYNGRRYTLVQPVKTIERIGGTAAQIIFRFNPGARDYYYRGYEIADQLTSESVDIPLPDRLRMYVYQAAVLMINGIENGDIVPAIDYIEKTVRKKINKEQNAGAQGDSCFATPRRA
jgi:hypothetical protein